MYLQIVCSYFDILCIRVTARIRLTPNGHDMEKVCQSVLGFVITRGFSTFMNGSASKVKEGLAGSRGSC